MARRLSGVGALLRYVGRRISKWVARLLIGVGAQLSFERRGAKVSDRCGRFLAFVNSGACRFHEILPWRGIICWVLMRSLIMPSAMEPRSSVSVRSTNDSRSFVTII